ncbi:MAG TPA: S41 family peptidase [Thermomonas sp.]
MAKARTWLRRSGIALALLVAGAIAVDVATYDPDPWLADYGRLKHAMAQGYANLDWQVARRGIDLPALDRETTAALRGAHSHVRAFLALRGFVRRFDDPHFRLRPGERPAPPTTVATDAATAEDIDPPAGPDCEAAGYEEGDHAFRAPFARLPGWRPLGGGDFPIGIIGATGVLRIAQFGEDRYLAACRAVFRPGIGERALQLAVRARQQAALRQAIGRLRAEGATRLLVDVSGNGGGTEWVSDVIALMTDKLLSRREPRIVGATCDRSVVWQGRRPPCEEFAPGSSARATLQGDGTWRGPLWVLADRGTGSAAEDFVAWLRQNRVATVIGARTAGAGCGYVNGGDPVRLRVVPVDVWMPNCARFLDNSTNEIEGLEPDLPLDLQDEDRATTALAKLLG